MIIIRRSFVSRAFLALAAFALLSCATPGGGTGTPDERAMERGVEAWNKKGPEAARGHWSEIKDAKAKKRYLGYIESFDQGEETISSALESSKQDEPSLLAASERALTSFSSLDERLVLPQAVRKDGLTLTEGRVKALLASGKSEKALDMAKKAERHYGQSDRLTALTKEADIAASSRKRAALARANAETAKGSEDFDKKISGFEQALAAYAKAEESLASDAKAAGIESSDGIVAERKNLKRERQDLEVERDAALRDRVYFFKDRIGEEFARVPEKGKEGSMSLEELLAHQETVKASIDFVHKEMTTFAKRYPESIDRELLDEVDGQKRDLELKIAQINNEIKTAKEIASRGKVVMPVMIGLFNPAPSSGDEGKKSRPAAFASKKAKKEEYWWGMVSIPRGEMNDLVITMRDSRTVRVFGENTKSGKLIEKNKMTDLVNRTYKVGNSWPVLNAGGQLPSNKYFFEIQPGKTQDYEGEAVVYSSFIMRMR